MNDKQADEMGHKVRQMLAAMESRSTNVLAYAAEISRLSGVMVIDVLSMAQLVRDLQNA